MGSWCSKEKCNLCKRATDLHFLHHHWANGKPKAPPCLSFSCTVKRLLFALEEAPPRPECFMGTLGSCSCQCETAKPWKICPLDQEESTQIKDACNFSPPRANASSEWEGMLFYQQNDVRWKVLNPFSTWAAAWIWIRGNHSYNLHF